MRRLTQYQIDAFAEFSFTGNPAAIVYTDDRLPPALMQAIAEENNLSETAFLTPTDLVSDAHYNIRWFTPNCEIEFCGHATIAAAHALHAHILKARETRPAHYIFHGQLGPLQVNVLKSHTHRSTSYQLRAPALKPQMIELSGAMHDAFPVALSGAFTAGPNLYLIAQNWQEVVSFQPDIAAIMPLCSHGVGLTARGGPRKKGTRQQASCTSRFFVPALGIDEDPVTGSAHTALVPYWAHILSQDRLLAYQGSQRGGWLEATLSGDHVSLAGPAITYAIMDVFVPQAG